MKKFALYLFLFSFIIIGVLLFLVATSSKESSLELEFEVYRNSNTANYKIKESNEYLLIEEEPIPLPNGSFIKTTDGTAFVILPDDSIITLDRNTEISIDLSETSTEVNQYSGRAWHTVNGDNFNEYIVNTASSRSSSSNGSFGVDVIDLSLTKLIVSKNQIVTGQKIIENGITSWINEKPVIIDQVAQITNSLDNPEGFKPEPLDPNLKETDWYKANVQVDNIYSTKNDYQRFEFINAVRSDNIVGGYFVYESAELATINISDELVVDTPTFDFLYLYDKFMFSNIKNLDGRKICASVNSPEETDTRKLQFIDHTFNTSKISSAEHFQRLKLYCSDNVLDNDEKKDLESKIYKN